MPKKALKKAARGLKRPNGAAHAAPKVALAMDPPDEASTYYINHAELGHTKHEFTLIVGRMPQKISDTAKQVALQTGEIKIAPTLQLLFPPTLIPDLIHILTEQRAKYEAKYGEIGDDDSAKEVRK